MKVKLFLLVLLTSCSTIAFSQSKKKNSKVKLTGNIGVYGDFYKMKSDTLGAVAPRRPDFVGRIAGNATLKIGQFSLPFSVSIAPQQHSVLYPGVPNLPLNSFKNIKLMASNPLNRIGIAPKYKWAQLFLGSHIPNYSKLSIGDVPIFGAGIALSPGKFRLSAFAGKSQTAIEADTLNNVLGNFARSTYAIKVGIGHEDSTHLYFINAYLLDDTNSLISQPKNTLAQEGLLSSLDMKILLSKKVYFEGEIAGTAFTRNMKSAEVPSTLPTFLSDIYTPNSSSRFDYASIASLGRKGKVFSIKTTGKYFGDGFVSIGYPFLQTDRLDVTIDPKLVLFKSKVLLNGAIGRRINNLSGDRAATSTQTIGNANAAIQLTKALSISGNYSNFGFRNTEINDTLKIEMITNSWSVSPTYSFTDSIAAHSFMCLYSQNIFEDFNTITGVLNDNNTNNALFSYSFSALHSPFSSSLTLSHLDNNSTNGKLLTNSVNLTSSYAFIKKKLKSTAGLTLAKNEFNNQSVGLQTILNAGLRYTLKKTLNFSLRGSVNLFDYGTSRPSISYQENLLRSAITYRF